MLIALAATYVGSGAAAEHLARRTWLALLEGLDGFDGRVPLLSWLVRILIGLARVSAADGGGGRISGADYSAGPGRFRADGSWVLLPVPWPDGSARRLRGPAAQAVIRAALGELPPEPRRVVLLRDVAGLPGGEVSELLSISAASQRHLLHRGRSRIRQALEQRVREGSI